MTIIDEFKRNKASAFWRAVGWISSSVVVANCVFMFFGADVPKIGAVASLFWVVAVTFRSEARLDDMENSQ